MLSSLTTVFAVGPLLAPIIGGALLVRFGWPSIFLFIALCAAALARRGAGLASPNRCTSPTAMRCARRGSPPIIGTFFTTRAASASPLVNGLCWVGIFAFISASPFVLIELYGVRPDHYGYYFGLAAVTLVLGAATNKRLLRRHPRPTGCCAGLRHARPRRRRGAASCR